jgi:hypothetical protein
MLKPPSPANEKSIGFLKQAAKGVPQSNRGY